MKILLPLIAFLIVLQFPVSTTAQLRCDPMGFPSLSFGPKNVFPKDGSLSRPEDGKALPDGRIVVADNQHGLRIIKKDGSHRPFGKFAEAGFENAPPKRPAAPNGVFLETGGKHLLVTDVYTGFIYRIDVKTEETQIIYRHEFGVNSLVRDRQGTIWFTQSAENNLKTGSSALYAAINKPVATGGVYMLQGSGFEMSGKAKKVADGFYLANGVALTRAGDRIFVAETMMDRVLTFEIDREKGVLTNRDIYSNVLSPDNLIVDSRDNLFIASAISNSVYAVDAKCGSLHRVFSAPSDGNLKARDAWTIGSRSGKPLISVLGPETFAPLPGILTGMFFSTDEKTLYVTGLGNAVMRFPLK